MQTIATFGVVGTLLMLGLFGFSMWIGWMAWQKTGDAWALLGLIASVFVFLSGWFTTWSFVMIVVFWVSLGLTRAGLLELQKAKTQPYAPFQMLAEVAIIFLAIFACIPMTSILSSDVATRNAQRWFDTIVVGKTTENAKAISQATAWLQRAVRWDEHNNTALLLLANTQAIQVKQDVDQNNLTDAGVALQAMQTTLTTATQRFGRDPITYETANNLLNILSSVLQNAVTDAKKNFAALRSIEPNNPIQDVGYGQVLMVERGQLLGTQSTADEQKAESLLTEALASYDAALAKKATYFQAHYAKAQALVSGERYQEAIDEMPLDQTAAASQVALTYQVRAQAYAGLKKDDLAVASYKSAINAYSKDSLTYILFSEYYKKQKKTTEAKKVLEDGLVALPQDAQLLAAKKALTSN
jgi:tetratricopeptide (TPR) repeat protein